MKVKISERAQAHLISLYTESGESCCLSHFLNKLITQVPIKEEIYDSKETEGLPALQ